MPVHTMGGQIPGFDRPGRKMYRKNKVKRLVTSNTKSDKVKQAIRIVDTKIARLNSKLAKSVEKRFKETYHNAGVASTGTILLLNGLTQGDTFNQREGEKIRMLMLRMHIQWLSSDTTNVMRTMVVYDTASKGVVLTLPEILDFTVVTNEVISFRNTEYSNRLKVLYDKTIQATTGTDSQKQGWNKNIRLNKMVDYGLGNAGTIADISEGALYLVLISDSVAITHPTANIGCRLTYIA